MSGLPDGRYDVLLVDVDDRDDDALVMHFTVVAGEAKGTVVPLRTTRGHRDPLTLLGLPATLEVVDGRPRVQFDRV